ncbi:MAG TPA: hypothetical protein DCM38_02400 [Gammaproteobacteria bacterium]|nr:hypothetical protein [Gammaproteobacteria bacterium]
MASLYIHDINEPLAQTYLKASKEEQLKIKRIVEEALTRCMQTPPASFKRRLLQKGSQTPFKPFKAVKMKGKGPSALEMVIQGRESV